MTTQTAGDIDVFASTARKPGVVQPDADPKPTQEASPKRKMSSFVEKVKPWHFIAVVAVVAAIWIFAPKFLHSSASIPQGQQFTAQKAQPTYEAYERSHPANPVEEPQNPPAAVSQQLDLIQVQGQMETFAKTTSELQGQVRELQAKIAVLESRPQDAAPKAKDRVQVARKQPVAAASSTSKALAGYSINTVYTDQAWLQHDQKTFVVQVGDAFDGIRILRIDPVSRQVDTNLGVIR
ncbi:hypothetical protein [Pseudomonas sp. MPC6]|uniref:hypothetical protein n=1 Tax=unclassified Pseudomonas TaxID=196821 RepID=UPI00111024B4|nr:hypothetical protein [Pseudomonas sp. MPC6]QCY09359.1 hypothetical protein ELQ88_00360 [Pseudomonas sp. MPC6]